MIPCLIIDLGDELYNMFGCLCGTACNEMLVCTVGWPVYFKFGEYLLDKKAL